MAMVPKMPSRPLSVPIMILAQTQHRKVSMLPTERSMLPVIITSVRPKAMMPV